MATISGFSHVGMAAHDPAALAAFYRDALGMTVTGGSAAGSQFGATAFLSSRPEEENHELAIFATPMYRHLAFTVASLADLRALHRQITARGIPIKLAFNHGCSLAFYFDDPEGNMVEVSGRPGSTTTNPTVTRSTWTRRTRTSSQRWPASRHVPGSRCHPRWRRWAPPRESCPPATDNENTVRVTPTGNLDRRRTWRRHAMAAYAVVLVNDVRDPESLGRYRAAVAPLVERYGGTYVAADHTPVAVEGQCPLGVVVIEFPSSARLRALYDADDYAPLKAVRLQSGDFTFMIVEGLPLTENQTSS